MNHAIDCNKFGIPMIVFTTDKDVKDTYEHFEKLPLSQVRSIHKQALHNATVANRYFDEYPDKIKTNRQKYENFCNDCLIVAVTGDIGFNRPIYFVHPSIIDKVQWDPKFDSIRQSIKLDLDPNIPMVQ